MKAIDLERNTLNESGGWQDQLHAAFGGFNSFSFSKDLTISQSPINLSDESISILNENMYILFSGKTRDAKIVESDKQTSNNDNLLLRTKDIALEGNKILKEKKLDLKIVGELLNEGWNLKKGLSKMVSNNDLNDIYNLILSKGAFGAKLCGAGGGGFFFILAKPDTVNALKDSLTNCTITPIKISFKGPERKDL